MAASAGASRIMPNKGAKSLVWDHFGFPCDVDGAVNNRKVVCRLCKLEFKGTGTATSSKQEMLVSIVAAVQPLFPSNDQHKALVAAMGTYLAKDMHPLAL